MKNMKNMKNNSQIFKLSIPCETILIGEGEGFSIVNKSSKSFVLLFNIKNKSLIRLNFFNNYYNSIIFNRIVFFSPKKGNSSIKRFDSFLNSHKKYLYRDLYSFMGVSEKIFHFVGVGYKIRYRYKRKPFRIFFWVGFCTWQVIRIPFPFFYEKNKDSFRLLSLKLMASSHLFIRIILLIKNIRLSEPYKGKGIRFMDEKIKRKPGKTGRI